MWSKRLEDIRPGTVMAYAVLLLGLGYLRVGLAAPTAIDWSFMGREYELSPWFKWLSPVVWTLSGLLANFILVERFQVLKRYSYIGFLWGLFLIIIGDFRIGTNSIFAIFWFASILRIQKSSRVIPDALDIGLLVGALSILNIQFLALIPISWILALTFARLRWRVIFASIWGAVTIHILTWVAYYLLDNIQAYLNYWSWPTLSFEMIDSSFWVLLFTTFLWWVFSLGNYFKALSTANIVKRQSMSALLFLTLMLMGLALSGAWSESIYLAMLPIGTLVFITNDLQYRRKYWWRDVVFWTFIAAYVIMMFPGVQP
ncbi:MAG: hypothetical protein HWE14_03140 [Flavobacteriia bacterium]|nr:hypothetical protein [Flavobacteriia bacterium]